MVTFAPGTGYFNSMGAQKDSESCELATYLGPCVYKSDS